MAAVARRQFCANLNVIIPQQVQCKPPLRQAAGTLAAMRIQHSGQCIATRKCSNNGKSIFLHIGLRL